jgi:hypothetical protein
VTNKFTFIDEDTGEIKIQLKLGSEYINAYNSDLFMTFPMNHDFRHLMRIQVSDGNAATVQQSLSVNACYFTIVYIIEKTKSVENNMMYKVTLERRKQREAALTLEPNEMKKTAAQNLLDSQCHLCIATSEVLKQTLLQLLTSDWETKQLICRYLRIQI